MLDIGCGTGNLTEKFFFTFYPERLVAFDLSLGMIRYAGENHSPIDPSKKMDLNQPGSSRDTTSMDWLNVAGRGGRDPVPVKAIQKLDRKLPMAFEMTKSLSA